MRASIKRGSRPSQVKDRQAGRRRKEKKMGPSPREETKEKRRNRPPA